MTTVVAAALSERQLVLPSPPDLTNPARKQPLYVSKRRATGGSVNNILGHQKLIMFPAKNTIFPRTLKLNF